VLLTNINREFDGNPSVFIIRYSLLKVQKSCRTVPVNTVQPDEVLKEGAELKFSLTGRNGGVMQILNYFQGWR
jgi:hypothetical protein